MKHKRNDGGFHHLGLLLLIVVLGVIGLVGWRVFEKNHQNNLAQSVTATDASGQKISYDKQVSNNLTGGYCKGAGSVSIGPPMPLNQTGFVLPYGLMVGGHVTPVDHQYYNGLNTQAPRDTYDVIAPADGAIVNIQHRGTKVNTPPRTVDIPSSDEYRLVMMHTCSFLTYVDLVTSLSDDVKAKLPKDFDPMKGTATPIAITKGEVIGHIGGQTLDFAVWDLTKPLKGFINPAAYTNSELWKIYTAPPSQYMDVSVKSQVIAKYIRTARPIDGQIDYDQPGKLIGTWFKQGSNGYNGNQPPGTPGYWSGHLSFSPDFLVPSTFVISTGTFPVSQTAGNNNGDPTGATQFWVKGNGPDPSTITPASGLVKYELIRNGNYLKPDGSRWDNRSFTTGLTTDFGNPQVGVALVKMISGGQIKVEFFAGQTAAQVNDFTSAATIYDRGDGAHMIKSNTAT